MKYGSFINTPVRNLSLGQRIRCEIVASLIHKPEILFLDEPTIGLDPVVKENVRSLIKKMNKEYKTTIFLTSHDIGDIEKLCKRVVIVNHGKIIMDDTMNNLKYHYLCGGFTKGSAFSGQNYPNGFCAFISSNTVMAVVPDSNRIPFLSTQCTTFQTVSFNISY